ncbi:MAG: hypothetical protein LUF29_10005 [Oscillospiraceae bacterium]|nr:hypothetical protein [Oscillospiraceae bacterium]
MKRTLAFLTVFCMIISMTACGNTEEENPSGEESTTSYNGVPDNVVTNTTTNEAEAVTSVEYTEAETSSETAATEETPEVTTTSDSSSGEATTTYDEDTVELDDEEEVTYIPDTIAMDYLTLLNSTQVHAKLTEATSYDGETVVMYEREYYISGVNKVYINNSQKIVMTSDTVTVIDLDAYTYYSYARTSTASEIEFGYSKEYYTLVSTSEEDDCVIEIYSVSSRNSTITSTWTFYTDGTFTVVDENQDSGSFTRYYFEVADSDVSGMDMTIPDGLTETEASEF